MSDEIKKEEAPKSEPSAELAESALDEVVGGNAVGKPTTPLFKAVITGEHIKTGKLVA